MRHSVPARNLARTLGVLPLSLAIGQGFAATFFVSNLNNSGSGSLRQALLDSNANPGPDSVLIDIEGEIPVTGGQLVVNGDVTIEGPGADRLSLNAAGANRVLQVASGHAQLSGLTLRNGKAGVIQSGGGVFVGGDLTLRKCALIGNEVPFNFGFNADGGAVFVNSGRRFVAEQCVFLDNRVGLGTGGAAKGASSSVIEFRNCTLSGNSATQGGALSSAGSLSLDFCTLADNRADNSGGGVWAASGPIRVSNSILFRNSAPSAPDWFGPAASFGFNLIGNPAQSSGWGATDRGGLDPLLAPLDPLGFYRLLEDSPALDAANPVAFLLQDQRDMSRPQALAPDIGAFEAEPFNEAPTADAGPDQVVECAGPLTAVILNGNASSDPDGDELDYAWLENGAPVASGASATLELGKGEHWLTLTVTDPSGASDSDEVLVLIVDTTAPRIGNAAASPGLLWPPNHKMVTIQLHYTVSDLCDPNPVRWLTAASSDPDSGMSPDDVPGDIEVVDANTVRLRAERFESGRTYTITIHARDADGNASSKSVTVGVPKSMGR